ncbi:hypothetical protein NQ314_016353 [Rhamnusium bicolor]|uniref:DDE Tnp4 domain-containing protein n=1 Tax=Rhamnusium bicolor TaxID=1586634 RepID=A0AAV8WYX3_9CUCU|nr:hypothetical protein NQ314_016353 [Rhamnusium bicolor]
MHFFLLLFQIFRGRSRGIPNVIGAIDGTDIFIKQPFGNAVDYYNRYQSHSVILQAVCDANKKFINISVGHPGRMHDARVFRRSSLYQSIINEDDPLIRPENHIIGDCAYPLLQEVLTPFRNTGHLTNGQIRYNTRFSSIRSIIERAFGLLKGKWKRLKYLDMSDMELLNEVITACCVLRNFIIRQGEQEDDEVENIDEEEEIAPIHVNERRRHVLGEIKREEIMNNLR